MTLRTALVLTLLIVWTASAQPAPPAQVRSSAPAADAPGMWRIHAQVPDGLSGQVPVFLTAGSLASNAVTVWVR